MSREEFLKVDDVSGALPPPPFVLGRRQSHVVLFQLTPETELDVVFYVRQKGVCRRGYTVDLEQIHSLELVVNQKLIENTIDGALQQLQCVIYCRKVIIV